MLWKNRSKITTSINGIKVFNIFICYCFRGKLHGLQKNSDDKQAADNFSNAMRSRENNDLKAIRR